jgi:hypothetical protein
MAVRLNSMGWICSTGEGRPRDHLEGMGTNMEEREAFYDINCIYEPVSGVSRPAVGLLRASLRACDFNGWLFSTSISELRCMSSVS